jgi:hypothetical protein
MRGAISLLSVLAAALLAEAADPLIVGEKSADWLVQLKVTGVEQGTAVLWDFYPQDTVRRVGTKKVVPISRECVFAGPKGKYDVLVRLVKGEDVTELTYTVEITGGAPPGPKPEPTPDPVIDRKNVSYKVVFVEETSEAAAGRGAMFTSKTLDDRMKAKKHTWRIVDKDNQGPDVQAYIKLAAEKKFPQIFLIDQDGKLPFVQLGAPTKAADLIALLEKYGG